MKSLGAAVLTLFVLLPGRWQPGVTATNDPKTETVVDASWPPSSIVIVWATTALKPSIPS